MNEGKLAINKTLQFSEFVEQRSKRLMWASIISMIFILFNSLFFKGFTEVWMVMDNLALVFILLVVYYMVKKRNFEIRKDWPHLVMFVVIIALQSLASNQLYTPIPEGISLIIFLGYPSWIFLQFNKFKEDGLNAEKDLLLNLTTITFALLILKFIRFNGVIFFDFHSEVNFVLFDGILQFIFFLFIASYFVRLSQLNLKDSKFPKLSIKKEPKIDLVELSEMARQVEQSLFSSKYFLYSGITLELVSEKTGYSRQQLSNLFSEYYNKNFYQLLGERRIENAISVMTSNNNITMDSVSDQCGFNSKSTFYKYFKKYTGYTPAVFMQNLQNRGDFVTIQ